jgi:hypothetical protein
MLVTARDKRVQGMSFLQIVSFVATLTMAKYKQPLVILPDDVVVIAVSPFATSNCELSCRYGTPCELSCRYGTPATNPSL